MAINSAHPSYTAQVVDWTLMRDAYQGERVVKEKGTLYLPPTPGQVLDGQGKPNTAGDKAYEAYKTRASFPDFVSDAVESYIGLLHQKPATIELPAVMEPMLAKASIDGESLQALLRRINVEQLVPGRVGLLLDIAEEPDPANPLPYIALYAAETIINWDESKDHEGVNALNLVVLDESGYERQTDLTWKFEQSYRVLKLGVPAAPAAPTEPGEERDEAQEPAPGDVYIQGEYDLNDGTTVVDSVMSAPMLRGVMLEQIPFVFVNSKDIIATPDNPPMIGLGRLCMTIYRGEADYRQTLFMQGQDTLVTVGGIVDPDTGAADAGAATSDGVRVGAGARIDLNMGGDAKYIGVSSTGLPEQRQALDADKKQASGKAGQLISPSSGKQESGDALTTRLSAQTATLNQIAKAGALALENILKIAAAWMGANPDEVVVTPNLEFVKETLPSKDLVELMSARTMGAPLSLESIHELIVKRGISEKTFEEEMALIEDEDLLAAKAQAKVMALLPAPAPAPAKPGAPAPSPAAAPAGAK